MTWSELSPDTCRRQVRRVAEGSVPFRYTNIQCHFSRRCFRLRIEQICRRAPSFETNCAASSRVSGSAQTSTSDICVFDRPCYRLYFVATKGLWAETVSARWAYSG